MYIHIDTYTHAYLYTNIHIPHILKHIHTFMHATHRYACIYEHTTHITYTYIHTKHTHYTCMHISTHTLQSQKALSARNLVSSLKPQFSQYSSELIYICKDARMLLHSAVYVQTHLEVYKYMYS